MLGLRSSGRFEIIWKRTLEKAITYPVVEKFVSVNGEGQRAGELAAFVRFAGCNLSCSYCDTAWANDSAARVEQVSLEDVLEWVRAQKVACVTLTGGEPTLQSGLPALVEALLHEEGPCGCGLWVEIETNGSVDLARLKLLREKLESDSKAFGVLSLTVDYKLPSSGAEGEMRASNYATLGNHDTVKFVCGCTDDLERAYEVAQEFDLPGRVPVYLSPVFGRIEPSEIVQFMISHSMNWAHIQLQLHKIIWPNVDKGV